MAIGMLAEFTTMDQKKYDRINELLDNLRNPPKGLIIHTSGASEKGWLVFDIWESQNAFDQFMNQRLQPIFDQLGISERPALMRSFPIHTAVVAQPKLLNELNPVGVTR